MRCALAAAFLAVAGCGDDGTAMSPPDAGGAADDAGGDAGGGTSPLEHLTPTSAAALSPGNAAGQDEDPSIVRALDGALYVAWYSNRNGAQPEDGVPDREIFLARSEDGRAWTDPPIQLTRHPRYSFYPSLAQDESGTFHLAWWRVTPTPEGCVPDVDCDGGATYRVMYKSSPNGADWSLDEETAIADGPGDLLPSLVVDRAAHRLLAYFASVTRAADGTVDLGDGVLRVYLSVHDGSGWSAPQRLLGVDTDASHDTFPHVVQRGDGTFAMTWTRYDAAASADALRPLMDPTTDTMFSTSDDGLHWAAPVVMSDGGAQSAIDALPYLYASQDGVTWQVLWITTAGAAPGAGRVIELAIGGAYPGDVVERPEIRGYSGHILATATPGIYWGVWVEGPMERQKIMHAFFEK